VKRATFYPLLGCNARCAFCSTRVYTDQGILAAEEWGTPNPQPLSAHAYPLADAELEYRRFAERGVESIAIQGGEPTLFEELPELIAYGKRIGIREQLIVTNGKRLADRAYVAGLMRSGLDIVALSIFGATAALHDAALGAPGTFDEVVQAVRNVQALRAEHPELRTELTGQLILYANNFFDLPNMLQFWHAAGISVFGIRLLRETENTRQAAEKSWFFDLEQLRAPLARCLDLALELGAIKIALSELPYCLLEPRHLAFVIRDLENAGSFRNDKLLGTRISLKVFNPSNDRELAAQDERLSACEDCSVSDVCLRIERQYLERFSEEVSPIDVAARFRELVGSAESMPAALGALLEERAELRRRGVAEDALLHAQRKLIRLLAERDQRSLCRHLLGRTAFVRLVAFLEKATETVFKALPLSGFGARALPDSPGRGLLDGLDATAPFEKKKELEFLREAEPLGAGPLLSVFGGRLPAQQNRPPIPYCVGIYDDAVLSEKEALLAIRSAAGTRASRSITAL
jgi:MoaA/NifB/PqqE/SkfB family radical SAM enzyme